MIGVMRSDHSHGIRIGGKSGNFGWGLHFYERSCVVRYVTGGGSTMRRNITSQFGAASNDSTIRFVVNRKMKTIHAQRVGGFRTHEHLKLIVSPETCKGFELPEELQICCSRCDNELNDVEIVEFKAWDYLKDLDEKESERFDFILEQFLDIKIPLQNKEVNLPRSFLIDSNIPNLFKEKKKVYRGLADLNLNVDEKKIQLTIFGKKVEYKFDELIHYFIFFRRLGMKREMELMIDRISMEESLVTIYEMLERATVYEGETIKSWFSTDLNKSQISEFTIDSFNTSFCLALFNVLKKRFSDLQSNPQIFLKFGSSIGFVVSHLFLYKVILDPMNHSDFEGANSEDLTLLKIFAKLYARKESANVKLRSTDGKEFACHREVLVFRFDHFHRMFKFEGAEREALFSDNPVIPIEDMDSKSLQCVLDYIYLGSLSDEVKISTTIRVLILSRKFLSSNLEKVVIRHLSKQIKIEKYETPEDVVGILREHVSVFHGDEEFRRIVLPYFELWSGRSLGQEKMKKEIRKGMEQMRFRSEVAELKEMVKVEQEKNEKLEEMVKLLQLQVQGLTKNMKFIIMKEKLGVDPKEETEC